MRYSKDWKEWKEYITIHGDLYTGCPVGYCHYYKHSGAITKNLLISHQCLGKECPKLEKNEFHPYWKEREKKLKRKKEGKRKRKEAFEKWASGNTRN